MLVLVLRLFVLKRLQVLPNGDGAGMGVAIGSGISTLVIVLEQLLLNGDGAGMGVAICRRWY
jgi:hypothetical protein